MQKLRIKHRQKVHAIDTTHVRDTINKIVWKDRLIGLKGARGVGKTTLLLQYIRKNFSPGNDNLYVSLDDVYFTTNSLIDFATDFVQNNGKYLFLDEVHRYKNWAQELKNIYDDYPELHVVFTGSSMLDIYKAKYDLSRRAAIYKMPGLSFREYLSLHKNVDFRSYTLREMLDNHLEIADMVTARIKPVHEFKNYLYAGYYPFFLEYPETYHARLEQVMNLVLEMDMPAVKPINYASISKLKKLLFIIATSAPFKPNVKKLSEKTGIGRNNIIQYLNYLDDANLLKLLRRDTYGISAMQKPEKIYLDNPSLMVALAYHEVDTGNLRETFFVNQLSEKHQVTYAEKSDFLVDNTYTFEVGGRNKTAKQIAGIKNAYLALDDMEYGDANKIPLWMLGFLY